MRLFFIFILTILNISSNAQGVPIKDDERYEYPTYLKGGYTIAFKVDSVQHLLLKKGNKTIIELASIDRVMLQKNLGYIGADFKDYFVFVQSFGSGNPHYIELIKKATGKNLLEEGAAWIDANEQKGYLLYSANDVPAGNDKMTLYHLGSGRKESFDFPGDIFDGPEILNRIEIAKLSDTQLVIKYETEKGTKTKVYSR